MLVILRNLGRKGKPLWRNASCCLWQPKYYIKFRNKCQEQKSEFSSADLDAGAHGGSNHAASDILTLGSGGLSLDNGAQQSLEVLLQLLGAEGNLADGAVDDVGLVKTVLDLTGLDFLDGRSDVGGHSTGLGGGHQTLGAQNLTQTANDTHHVGGSDDDVKVKPVFLGDLFNQIHTAGEISACSLSFFQLSVLGENQNLAGLAGAVGQNDGAANLLVSVTGVNAQLNVHFNGLVELGGSGLNDQTHGVGHIVLHAAVNQLGAVFIFLTSKQCNILLSGDSE